jgi:hypothetical protein
VVKYSLSTPKSLLSTSSTLSFVSLIKELYTMVAPLAIHILLQVVFLSFFHVAPAFADFKTLPENGWYFDLKGYQGSEFESIQYLPQCGSLGVGLGSDPKAIGDRCNTATNAFRDSNELAAFYDLDGTIQPQLTNGTESCLCMGLQTASTFGSGYSDRAAVCLWISAAGDLESIPLQNSVGQVTEEQGYIGNYVPDLKRSLLLCLDVDLEKIQADHANSTTPPPPLRDTNKIPACVSCKNLFEPTTTKPERISNAN